MDILNKLDTSERGWFDKARDFYEKVTQSTIPKELEPLATEARKYKSAEEFVDKTFRFAQATEGVRVPVKGSIVDVKFKGGGGGEFKVIDTVGEKVIVQRLGTKNRISIRHDEVVGMVKGSRKFAEAQPISPDVAESSIQEFTKRIQRAGFTDLTDFYNQATKGITEAPIKKPLEEIFKEKKPVIEPMEELTIRERQANIKVDVMRGGEIIRTFEEGKTQVENVKLAKEFMATGRVKKELPPAPTPSKAKGAERIPEEPAPISKETFQQAKQEAQSTEYTPEKGVAQTSESLPDITTREGIAQANAKDAKIPPAKSSKTTENEWRGTFELPPETKLQALRRSVAGPSGRGGHLHQYERE